MEKNVYFKSYEDIINVKIIEHEIHACLLEEITGLYNIHFIRDLLVSKIVNDIKTLDECLDIIFEINKEFNFQFEIINYEKIKKKVEEKIINSSDLIELSKIKVQNKYRYDLIQIKLHNDIDKYVDYMKEYFLSKSAESLVRKKDDSEIELYPI